MNLASGVTPTRAAAAALLLALLLIPAQESAAQDAPGYFKQNCFGCHTVGGGRLVGPDLKNVSKRKDRAWLTQFILDPQAMIDSGDPYASKLVKEAGGKVMSQPPGVNKAMASALLDLIQVESKLDKSQFKGVQVSARPFVPEDIAAGRRLFTGRTRFLKGGPSCNACHTVNKLDTLYGGTLGPDLSRVFGRIGGRKSLSAWLVAPGSAVMAPVYRRRPLESDEILSLVAFLEDCSSTGGVDESPSRANFALIAFIGAGLCLGLFDFLWKSRFRAVRKPLVEKSETGVKV